MKNLRLLLAYAGKDLSWCFSKEGFPLNRVNQYGVSAPIFPPLYEKELVEQEDFWWRDALYVIGKLTCLERRVRIINTLTGKTTFMNVCEEDTIAVVKGKYRDLNSNADSYIWRKRHSRDGDGERGLLFMNKTLTQNGILYHQNEQLGLPPAIWLYFTSNTFCQ